MSAPSLLTQLNKEDYMRFPDCDGYVRKDIYPLMPLPPQIYGVLPTFKEIREQLEWLKGLDIYFRLPLGFTATELCSGKVVLKCSESK